MTKLRTLALAIMMALSIAIGPLAFSPNIAYAQVDTGLAEVGSTVKLNATDPRVIAARIINVALGLLGIIMLSMILYAGFLWMTSGGDSEKVERAKLMIRNAIIGLVIILSSWGIATFIIRSLLDATSGGAGPSGGSGPGGGGVLPGGGGSTSFQVTSISPSGATPIRNVQARFILSRSIDAATANANIRVIRVSDSSVVSGSVVVTGQIATFTPSADCPAPNTDRKCFDENTEYRAEILRGLRSTAGQAIVCGGFAPECSTTFTTGSLVDTAPPTAAIRIPFDGQSIPADDLVIMSVAATDDAGISYTEAFAGSNSIGIGSVPAGASLTSVSTDIPWDTTGVAVGPVALSAQAHDIDSNVGNSAEITVMVRPAHCFNGTRDEDETDIDCGGASCGVCSGGACTTGSMCASGVCTGGVCVEQPIITRISPPNGRPGTLVTVSGVNFGSAPGQIIFADGQVATAPAACVAAGVTTWSPTQVVIAVPDAAVDGPIQIVNTAGLSDISNDDRGPAIDPFDVNDVARPGLCGAVPNNGLAGERFELVGAGLGTASDRVFFNDREVSAFLSWSDERIALNAPVITPATYAVTARSGGVLSNSVSYRVNTRVTTAGPEILSLSPDNGPISEYVTIQGRNFGSRVGRVYFRRGTSDSAIADTDFPVACSVAFWTDTLITVKVPGRIRTGLGEEAITPGSYNVEVERQDSARSNTAAFAINTASPRPGICAIQPVAGPVDTELEIVGERFGSDGTVNFSGSGATRVPAIVAAGSWSGSRIQTRVPLSAITGQVDVTAASVKSNPVNFSVKNCNEDVSICTVSGSVCCENGACSDASGVCAAASRSAMFAWRLSTGVLPVSPRVIEECSATKPPSPSPWADRSGGNQVCVNSDIYIRFNTTLKPTSVSVSGAAASLIVRKCTAGGENPCSATSPVTPASGYPSVGVNDGEGFIRYRTTGLLDAGSTYQVILTTAIQSSTDVPMLENADKCGAGNAYCFTFVTRPTTDLCQIGSVNVVPNPHTMNDVGIDHPYNAVPRAAEDECIVLRGDVYNWSWATSDGRASVTNNINTLGNVSEDQIVTSNAETGSDPVRVNASVVDAGRETTGRGDLFVRLVPPKIEAYGPNCSDACLNAAIWARFNVPMNAASVDLDNVIIKRCTNENCRTFDETLDLSRAVIRLMPVPGTSGDTSLRYLIVEPTRPGAGGVPQGLLERGRFYKVTVLGGMSSFRSRSGLPLSGLNEPLGFSWKFRVKDDENARCSVESVSITPGEKIETVVGERQPFTSLPVSGPTACNAEGEPLIVDRTFSWSIEQTPTVSKYVNGGDGRRAGDGIVDTNPTIAAGCTNRCTPKGASGVVGRVASCGNRVVETTNPNYCRNAAGTGPCGLSGASAIGCLTIHRDACRLLEPGSKGGEECDEGSPTSACGSSCLWLPLTGGTCGNGILNRGEQCDRGPEGARVPGCSDDCQLLGSAEGGSVCGNGSIGDGEACDDGNTTSGDGCNADCLHEGSGVVRGLCGNGTIETGETCERIGGAFAASCNPETCLKNGTSACAEAGGALCCGNAILEAGEDCDDGNVNANDGCSAICLAEGSSAEYGVPSFCGDGVTGPGEINSCEATAGDGLPDAYQLAEIVGEREPDADGRMLSSIRVLYDEKQGSATYGLQCGFTSESACPAGTGLDNAGCCAPRPRIASQYPPSLPAGTGICRNAMITARFNTRLEDGSVPANFIVAERVVGAGATCPAGTTTIVQGTETSGTSWWQRLWMKVTMFFGIQPAYADVYCVGTVRGRALIDSSSTTTGSLVTFQLERALKPDTEYRVIFKGDESLANNPASKEGIRTARGVVSNGSIMWDFRTGTKICTISAVRVTDLDVDSPNLYSKLDETHPYVAQPISLQDGRTIPLSSVAEYDWSWDAWLSSDETVVEITPNPTDITRATGRAKNKNGSAYISAGVKITNDEVTVPSTTNRIIRGSRLATVLLCENPWPARTIAPFSDRLDSESLNVYAPDFAASGQYYNFSTLYCRDKNEAGTTDDLPAMSVKGVAPSSLDAGLGILRQYLFTFNEPELRGDGIGIRIVSNPLHQSPSAWYVSRGFSGSPTSITVDGYEAVKDGNTIYIGAVNTSGLVSGDIYPNIYVISRNPDAKAETVDIFDQLVTNFVLNVNLQEDSQNACVYAAPEGTRVPNETYRGADGRTVACTADWECLAKNQNLRCASFKTKMQRDIKRISDFQRMTNSLEAVKERGGKYPGLLTGTFIQTISNSRWPSWQGAFTAEIGSAPPVDPVNRFMTCGVCSSNGAPCMDTADCPAGDSCNQREGAAYAGIETSTCWNPTTRQFVCPRLNATNPYAVSRMYQYRSLNAGQRYELATELEGPSYDRYRPRLLTEIKRCTNFSSVCNEDSDCTIPGPAGGTGSCLATGGSWRYAGLCDGSAYGADSVCGNGVIGPGEICEVGDTRPASCSTSAVPNGTKLQVCNNCTEYVDSASSICVANAMCGNGRIDRNQCLGGDGYRYGQACNTPGSTEECRDPRDRASSGIICTALAAPEICDDGSLNGTYGRCNRTCSGYDAYCGDGRLSPGETCDQGAANGQYCAPGGSCPSPALTCSLDCRGPAPYCGDRIVTAPNEQCDGNTQASNKALCIDGPRRFEPCDTSADCGEGFTCGGTGAGALTACTETQGLCTNDMNRNALLDDRCAADADCVLAGPPVEEGRCIQYPTQRVRSCKNDVARPDACSFNDWSACQPVGGCGDGRVSSTEECDDGNREDNDRCTNVCKTNICGDGAVNVGVEECDNGDRNGSLSCSADYGSTCLSCSLTCRQVASSGGFCGNAIKEGPEQCDRGDTDGDPTTTGDATPSCRSLGYDYAKQVICAPYTRCISPTGDLHSFYTGSGSTRACITPGPLGTCLAYGPETPSLELSLFRNNCVAAGNNVVGGSLDPTSVSTTHAIACRPSPTPHDAVTCTSACGFSGCARCSEETGDGRIAAQVFDAIYSNQPVPNARVTLYSRGVRIAETNTNSAGEFEFNNINRVRECSQYRIVVDYYRDNPCTGSTGRPAGECNGQVWPAGLASPDEGRNGGYWPFESQTFAYNNFLSRGINDTEGRIYLAPRVGRDETLVIQTWNGALPRNAYTDAHITLPDALAPTRDIYYSGPGDPDIDGTAPHGFLACFHNDGSVGCGTFDTAPQTIKYKRGTWALTGRYGYYLVDYSPASSPGVASYQYFDHVSTTVRIVTEDRLFTVRPPTSVPTDAGCSDETLDRKGKYWHVFSQEAGSGAVTIPGSGRGLLLCNGSNQYGDIYPGVGVSLPGPVQGPGS